MLQIGNKMSCLICNMTYILLHEISFLLEVSKFSIGEGCLLSDNVIILTNNINIRYMQFYG